MDNIIRLLCVCVILLHVLLVVDGTYEKEHPEIEREIKPYADSGGIIDDFFKPVHILGEGTYGAVWKGFLEQNNVDELDRIKAGSPGPDDHNVQRTQSFPTSNQSLKRKRTPSRPATPNTDWKPIAMKILAQNDTITFEKECAIYKKLLAHKNQTVLQYGISAVWYKGDLLNKFHAIGMTLCTVSVLEIKNRFGGQIDSTNLMIILYQALFTLKYIHGKEIIHEDIKMNNLMVKGAKLFIIDFNAASTFDEFFDEDENRLTAPIKKLRKIQKYFLDDLKLMYDVILMAAGIEIPYVIEFENLREHCKQIKSESVQKLLLHYYDEVTRIAKIKDGDRIFNYDAMANNILDVIEILTRSRYPFFTWLKKDEKSEAIKHLISIENVPGPQPIASP